MIDYGTLKKQSYAEVDSNKDTEITMEVDKGNQIYVKTINANNQDVVFNKPSLTIIAE